MSPKRFLLTLLIVYIVLAIPPIVLFGGPNYSQDYLDEYGDEHDVYLSITKSEAYKLYSQRPHLIEEMYEQRPHLEPDLNLLYEQIEFVEEYESRPEFIAERRRIDRYNLYFQFLNFGAMLALILRFGWRPLIDFLDGQVKKVRTRIEQTKAAREEAQQRKDEANKKIQQLPDEKQQIASQTDAMIEQEVARIRETAEQSLAQIDQETEERKRVEMQQAAMQVKQELVEQAIDRLAKKLDESAKTERQSALIDEYVQALDERKQAHG